MLFIDTLVQTLLIFKTLKALIKRIRKLVINYEVVYLYVDLQLLNCIVSYIASNIYII